MEQNYLSAHTVHSKLNFEYLLIHVNNFLQYVLAKIHVNTIPNYV